LDFRKANESSAAMHYRLVAGYDGVTLHLILLGCQRR
jgi:hypothetical protein